MMTTSVPQSGSLPNFNVLMLGASGSGKTVFLSSMFHKLSTQGDRGFFLKLNDQGLEKSLTQTYGQVVTGEKWPQGTQKNTISKWEFTCYVQSNQDWSIFRACQFTYFDYAGARLTDPEEGDEETSSEFNQAVEQAHVLVGLLDGEKLLKAMQGDQGAWLDLTLKDLAPILQTMQFSQAPIHFMINKYDLLQDEFSLHQIRQRLLEYPKFGDIVRSRIEASTVRLIPVSSVGKGFATLQADGSMKKTTGSFPEPFQVEMPFACVVPDFIEHEITKVKARKESIEKPVEVVEANLNFWDRTLQFSVGALKVAQIFAPIVVGEILFDWFDADEIFLRGVNRKIENAVRETEELRQKRDEELKQVENQETAFRHTLNCFIDLRNKLESEFPESMLKGASDRQVSESSQFAAQLS